MTFHFSFLLLLKWCVNFTIVTVVYCLVRKNNSTYLLSFRGRHREEENTVVEVGEWTWKGGNTAMQGDYFGGAHGMSWIKLVGRQERNSEREERKRKREQETEP